MGQRDDVLRVAAGEVGYKETRDKAHPGGNVTKYWAEVYPAGQGWPYCDAFCVWTYRKAFVTPVTESFHVFTSLNHYRRARRTVALADALPADQVMFSIGQGHTGILESIDHRARTVTCIEANTSAGTVGSQHDGQGVYRRTRSFDVVAGVGRPMFAEPVHTPVHTPQEPDMAMPRSIPDPKTPADPFGRRPHWEVDTAGNVYCWDGARQLKSLGQLVSTHPPIVDIALAPSGDGVVLFGADGRLENGVWARSTYEILAGP